MSESSSESELSKEEKDEQFDREFTRGTNRKSRNEVTQRSSFSHNGARAVGLPKCSVMEDEATPTDEIAKQMGRQALEVVTAENAVVNHLSGRRTETMCKEGSNVK